MINGKEEFSLTNVYARLDALAPHEVVGKSVLGRGIRRYTFGSDPKVLLTAGVHGREWITVLLVAALAERVGKGVSFDLIPCLNPDGTLLAAKGLGSVPLRETRERLLAVNGNEDFSGWKANASGVDVNVNFDADWGEGRSNLTRPAPANYIGTNPESEPETQAAVRALRKNYALIACYHSLGEEVYWGYESNFRHYEEAKEYASFVGYTLKRSEHSAGGMKDYYALRYEGLGLTVEVGEEKYGHPYPVEKGEELYKKHEGSVEKLAELGERIHGRIYAGCPCGGAKGV